MDWRALSALWAGAFVLSCSGVVLVGENGESTSSGAVGGASGHGAGDPSSTTAGTGGASAGGAGGQAAGAGGAGGGSGSKDVWSKAFVGPFLQNAVGISADAAGNAIVTGTFSETMDIGGVVLKAPISYDESGFVVKLDPTGGYLWSRVISASSHCFLRSSTIDPAGNVLLTGETWGALAVDGKPIPGGSEGIFLVKLDPQGQILWGSVFGGQLASADSVVADAQGDVYLAGGCSGPVQIGGGTMQCPMSGSIFVLKVDPGGQFVWGTLLQGYNGYSAQVGVLLPLAIDGNGNTLVGTNDQADSAAVLLDPSGALIWAHPYTDCGIYAVGFDAAGDALLAGAGFPGADLGDGPLAWGSGFVISLSPAGAQQWHREINVGDYENNPWSIAASAANVIGVVGWYEQSAGQGGILSAFLIEVDTAGTPLKSSTFGPTQVAEQKGRAIAFGPTGDVYVTGDFRGKIDIAGKTLKGVDLDDVFVARLGPSP